MKKFLAISALCGLLGVALGAFGAHALSSNIETWLLDIFKTGVQYHMYHTFAIALVAILIKLFPDAGFARAGWFFLFGIILFSGSLYLFALSANKIFAYITPVGGLSFIVGWAILIWKAILMEDS